MYSLVPAAFSQVPPAGNDASIGSDCGVLNGRRSAASPPPGRYVHSPYGFPVLRAGDMCEATAAFFSANDNLRVSAAATRSSGGTRSSLGSVRAGVDGDTADSDAVAPKPGPRPLCCGGDAALPLPPPPVAAKPTPIATPVVAPAPIAAAPIAAPSVQRCAAVGNRSAAAVRVAARHTALSGRCEFLRMPEPAALDALEASLARMLAADPNPPPAPRAFRLFFTQLSPETTAAELRWIVATACGAVPADVAPRDPGAFAVSFRTRDEHARASSLDRRLLADNGGVWFARTPEQHRWFLAHAHAMANAPAARGCRLPTEAVVVEAGKYTRSQRVAARRAAAAAAAAAAASLAAEGWAPPAPQPQPQPRRG